MLLLFLKMEYIVLSYFKQGFLEARGRSHRNYYSRMKRYFYDFWNVVDLLSYALLITALCVRHFHPSENFTVARRIFSLSLLVMYMRFLEVFLVHRKMGPTLIMIKEMVILCFFSQFCASFRVMVQACKIINFNISYCVLSLVERPAQIPVFGCICGIGSWNILPC